MKPSRKSRAVTQRGSALFIILIGIALFAGLSYAVAQMMRGGDPNAIGEEKARLYSDEILNYGRSMRQAAQNLKISNACTDLDISLENNIIAGYEHTPVAADNCKLFHSSGGGMVYLAPSKEWLDMQFSPASLRGQWFFPGKVCVPGTGTAAAGCNSDGQDNEAIIAVLPYVRKAVCIEINKGLGITNPGGNPPQETGNGWVGTNDKYAGSQSNAESLDQAGRMAGCFEGGAASTPPAKTYHYFQILVPR